MARLGIIEREKGASNICVDDFVCGPYGRQERRIQISRQGRNDCVNFTEEELSKLFKILTDAGFKIWK
jgi:hypothetical protein